MKHKSTLRDKLRSSDRFFGTSTDLPRLIEIDLVELRPNPDQPRKEFDKEALEELAASIKNHGLINPITVSESPKDGDWKGFFIVAGERRFRAHQLLDRKSIPAIITGGNPEEIALIENIQREDLSPLEEAEALVRLKDRYDYTDDDLAGAIGKSRSTVTNYLGITKLPQAIKDECSTSNIGVSKSVLIEISKLKTAEAQIQLWETLKSGAGTVKTARSTKQRSVSPPTEKAPEVKVQEAITAGRNFVRRLGEIAIASPSDQTALAELHTLRGKIEELYRQLTSESAAEH